MNEAKKTNALRGKEFVEKYFQGNVIDIGAGDDLVCEWAERFDIEDGDANEISKYRKLSFYDTVHSSHCLEHMRDPAIAISDWWSLVKPGGYLVVVVPDEDLYEQGIWPSRFNRDHKHTFCVDKSNTWSPASHDIKKLVAELPGSLIISTELHDYGYDYSIQFNSTQKIRSRPIIFPILEKLLRLAPVYKNYCIRKLAEIEYCYGVPVDQTLLESLAQIQIIAKKAW